jgi:hypothetical protein
MQIPGQFLAGTAFHARQTPKKVKNIFKAIDFEKKLCLDIN